MLAFAGPLGYLYKDKDASADGVSSMKLLGGAAGKSKVLLKAANNSAKGQTSLPTGIAAGAGRLFARDGADPRQRRAGVLLDDTQHRGEGHRELLQGEVGPSESMPRIAKAFDDLDRAALRTNREIP